jgi:hypothetical protein
LPGVSGSSGTSGISGSSGTSGTRGSSGTSGANGANGTSGSSGTSGAAGAVTSYTNAADNRVLTSVSSNTINGEANLTFDATTLYINGALGVGTTTPTTTGLIRATNDIVAYYSSDERLKDNKQQIQNALEKILSISGYEFDWIPKDGIHENEGHDIGIIAQEVRKVIPEIVTTRDNGYLAVKYEKLVAVLIEAIKELKQEIDELKKEKGK